MRANADAPSTSSCKHNCIWRSVQQLPSAHYHPNIDFGPFRHYSGLRLCLTVIRLLRKKVIGTRGCTEMGMTDRHNKFCALLVVLLAAFSTMPLFQPYFFASSDGPFHLYRLMEYDTVLRDGVWYPRWAPDFFYGLGMPLFNYYAPLTYYVAEVFHLLGAGYIDSLRLFAVAAMVVSGLGAYVYFRTLLSPLASLLGAVVYMYVPYHLVNLYYRGDLAEYAAYTWFPLILWAVTRLVQRRSFGYVFAGSVSYGALILTHNLSAFIFSGFLVIYCIAALVREHQAEAAVWRRMAANVLRLGAMAAFAWALTAFFWVPALAEKSLVDFDRLLVHYDFREAFPTLQELLSTSLIHQYGVVFRTSDVYGYKLGVLQVVFLVVGLVLLVWGRRRFAPGPRIEAAASMLVAAISLFFIFPVSTWVWENAPLLSLAQFPWRFLAFMALPSALFAGSILELLTGRARFASALALVAVVTTSSVAGMFPMLSDVKEADVSPRGSMVFEIMYGAVGMSAAGEYLPKWVKQRPVISSVALAAVLGEADTATVGGAAPGMEATLVERKANRATYRVHAEKAGPFTPYILYFPGWVASVDGREVNAAIDDPSGFIRIEVPEGDHLLRLRFAETPLRQLSDGVSVFALLSSLGALVVSLKGRRFRGVRLPALGLNRENLFKAGLIIALLPAWLLAKSAFDRAYLLPAGHASPLIMNLDNEVLVEGYDLSGVEPLAGSASRALPGSSVKVSLYWRLFNDDSAEGYRPFVRLTNVFDQTWAYAESIVEKPQAGAQFGSTNISTLDLAIPPATPPGVYRIEAGFQVGPERRFLDVRRVQVAPILPSEKSARIGPIIVGRISSIDSATAVLDPSGPLQGPANFGDRLHLLDVSLKDGEALISGRPGAALPQASEPGAWQVRAGEVVHLDLLWQAAKKLDEDLTVTVRLASADGSLWAIRDSQPADGTYPTSFWAKDEVVRDQLNLAIPPETPPGQYELQLEVVSSSAPLSILDSNRAPIGPTLRIGKLSVSPSARPADLESIVVQRRTGIAFPDGLSILGYTTGRQELTPGEQLRVDVFWQATRAIAADVIMRLELVDKDGKPGAAISGRPVGDAYPTTAWRQGEVLRGQYSLAPKASALGGEVDLRIELIDASSGRSLAGLSIDYVRILSRDRSFTANPTHQLSRVFDNKIRLLGYDVAGETRELDGQPPRIVPGERLRLTIYWRALGEMDTNYTVFAQIINAGGRLVAQHDSEPQAGKARTISWVQEEVVADEHDISIPADLPEGDYAIITGLYDGATGSRLPAEGGGDSVLLTPLHVSSTARR